MFVKKYTRNEWGRWKTTLETSGEDEKLHSKRVGKMKNYTRNVVRGWKNTLETGGEDVSFENIGAVFPVAAQEPFMYFLIRGIFNQEKLDVKTTLETGGEDVKLHSKRVGKMWKLQSKRV